MNTPSNPEHAFVPESNLRGKLVVLLSVAFLTVTTLVGYLIWSGSREIIQSAEITSRNYAAVIEARLDATLRRADAHLLELTRDPPVAALSKQAMPRYARDLDARLDLLLINFPELAGLRVFDANGDQLYSSARAITPRVNIEDRSYFRQLRDQPQAAPVFEVNIARTTGRPTLVVARPMRDKQGVFHGIAIASVELEYFQKLFRLLDVGAHGVVSIYRSDNFTLVARWPVIEGSLGRPLPPGTPTREAIAAGSKTVTLEFAARADGVVRIYSLHALDRYPFYVTVGMGREDALAGWKVRALAVGLSALLLLVLLAGLLYRLWRTESRRARAADDLIVSDRRHRDLIATTPGAMYEFRIDSTGRRSMPFISEGVVALTGLQPAEIMTDVEVAFRRVPAAATPALEQSIRDSLENLTPWLHEFPYRTTTGADKWLRGHSIPRREADGSTRWHGVFVDITDRKRVEESRARLAAIVEHANDAIIGRTLDGTITSWNAAAERLFGYTALEAIGQPVSMLRAPGLPALRSLPYNNEQLLRGEYLPPVETKRITKDGLIIDVMSGISPIKNEAGDVVGAAVIVRDISERKITEIALRLLSEGTAQLTGETFFNEIASQVARLLKVEIGFVGRLLTPRNARIRTLGLCIDGQILPAVEYDIAQTPCEAVIGKKATIFPRDIQQLFPADRMLVDLGVTGYAAVPLLDMKGLPLGHIGVMSRAPLDNPQRIEALLRLFAVRVAAEIEGQALEEQLRQAHKMEAIGTLAGGIAHDFNNILASIIGNTELARQDVGAGHPALESLTEISKASTRARDLVQQILTFSRKQTPAMRALTLPPIIEEAVKLIRAALPASIHLTTVISPQTAGVRIRADPTLLLQVMINLCANAAYAIGGELGRIDINLERIDKDARKAQNAGLASGHRLHLSVRDTGCSMDATTLEHLFDPFFTTKATGEGTGLGLSVVHGIMQAHEGAIHVDSQPGEGSTFHLYFPVADAAVADEETAPEPPLPAAAGRNRHVLYVDDDGALVFMLTRLLERQGYRVSGHTSARKALNAVRADPHSFDLVVTDYNMPEMSGLDLAREIHAIRADLPVALTSGYITDELRRKSVDSGLSTLIYKPNTVDELCEAVHRLTRE